MVWPGSLSDFCCMRYLALRWPRWLRELVGKERYARIRFTRRTWVTDMACRESYARSFNLEKLLMSIYSLR